MRVRVPAFAWGAILEIRLSAQRLFFWHVAAIAVLLAANLAASLHDRTNGGSSKLFRMAFEANVPTLFSTAALAAATAAAWLLSRASTDKRETRAWTVFACILAFMAIDESAQLHEKLNRFGDRGPDSGMFSSIGVLPYAVVALALGVFLFRLWLRQSWAVRLGLAGGGLLYVASAIGLELIQNAERALDVSQLSLHMIALVSAEETGEMLAVAILLRTLLTKLAELGDRYPLTLRLDASSARA